MRERQRVAKQQDKMRRQQQFQMEREMRTQQIIEVTIFFGISELYASAKLYLLCKFSSAKIAGK